jgi:ABC-2 type transport system permease protein
MNIFFHELRAYRKSTVIWTLSLLTLVVFFLSIYPSFAKDADQFSKLLQGYPEPVRKALGLELDRFFTILGFYSYGLTFISLTGAIQAMNIGTSIVSKEVREKTADFLLTKPVTRTKILSAKIYAALTSLFLTNLAYVIASTLMAIQVSTEDFSTKAFLMISFTLFFIQLMFLATGLCISVFARKINSVLSISLGTVFTFFIIGMLISTSGDEVKRYLSPFKYFDHAYIIKHSSYEVPFILVGLIWISGCCIASFLVYKKRDIHAV